jgi:hypothetical protein
LSNGGTLEATNGATLNLGSGTTVNTGTISIDHGTMTFANTFTQTTGILDFGLNSATDFGQMTFSGGATLGGTLEAHLGPGYTPGDGDSFAVLNYGNNNPAFTNLVLPRSNDWTNTVANGLMTLLAGPPLPYTVTVSPTNSVVPVGATVTLVATAVGPGPLGYQWLRNGVDVKDATNTTLTIANATKSASGSYTVSVSNPGGSLVSDPVEVLVLAPPAIVASPQSQTVWVGTNVELRVSVSGDAPLVFQWSFNAVAIAGATNSVLSFADVTRAQAGSYAVTISNAVGIATSASPAVLSVVTGVICPGAPGGMVAWWRGDGDSSDYAGTNDAVFEGAIAYAPGEAGQAFSFDGASSYLQVADSPEWNFGTNDFSLEFWANFAATNTSIAAGDGSVAFLAHDEISGGRDKWIFGAGGGEIYFYVNGPGVGPRFLVEAPFAPQTNQWRHLGLTKADGVFRIFEDGAVVSVATNSLTIPSAVAPLTVGQAEDFFMPGLMDEISIYDRALSSAEMFGIYAAGGLGKCESAEPLLISEAGFNSSGRFQFQILGGRAGSTLHVQSSPDLRTWGVVGHIVPTGGPILFTDTISASRLQLYYRVISTP